MKTALLAVGLYAVAAFGGTASIVASFRTPCTNGAYGIDYHSGYIYHADPHGTNQIFKTNTIGSIIESYSNVSNAHGIDRTDFEFWTACHDSGYIFRLTTSGSPIRSFKAPDKYGNGITYGEGFLWFLTPQFRPTLYKYTVEGSIVNYFYFSLYGTGTVNDICWDAPYIWIAGHENGVGYLWQITQTGSVKDSIKRPTGYYVPFGVSCEGSYLWASADYWVYKINVSHEVVTYPASLGEVKALYR